MTIDEIRRKYDAVFRHSGFVIRHSFGFLVSDFVIKWLSHSLVIEAGSLVSRRSTSHDPHSPCVHGSMCAVAFPSPSINSISCSIELAIAWPRLLSHHEGTVRWKSTQW